MRHHGFAAAALLALAAPAFAQAPARPANPAPTAPKAAPARPAPQAAPAPGEAVRVTDTSKVCMVNNQYMGKEQIPVDVGGKRYYGCCAMCKERLAKDPAARSAVDPVTGKPVDKATAVIAAQPDGKVLYFESEANRKKYRTN